MNVRSLFENDILTLFISGSVSSVNAAEFEAAIKSACDEHPDCPVVLDIDELTYISSAGLRVFLRLMKVRKGLKVINACPEVYDIFEMTGFTEMLEVHKALRRVSVEGCKVIGRGANGEVYRINDDTILKLYVTPNSMREIENERELARLAFVNGIATAIPFDIVRVGSSFGTVFELLNAQSLVQVLNDDPSSFDRVMDDYISLLKQIHATTIDSPLLPSVKNSALRKVSDLKGVIPDWQTEKLASMISAIPDEKILLHGDYHFKNTLLQNGELLLIDMDTLCTGHPIFEFAAIYMAYLGYAEVSKDRVTDFIGISYEMAQRVWRTTLELYFGKDNEELIADVALKARIIGYMTVLRRTVYKYSDDTALIELFKLRLTELLPQVESLYY